MKKVKYDYIPPFGTDIKILEVMSKNASRKLHNALGKVGTIKKLGGGAQFMNLINNSKNDKVAHGASGTYDILPKTQYVDTFFAGHEESKFTNGTTRQRSPWNSSRKHVDAIRHAAGVDPKTGEFVPIYNVKETTFTDGATHQRTPWSTTKKHFTFDNIPVNKDGSNTSSDTSIICSIALPKKQSDVYCASSMAKAPWATQKKIFNDKATVAPDKNIPYDPNAAYNKIVRVPVLSPTEALYGPDKSSMKKQYDRKQHVDLRILNPPHESPNSKRKVISPRISPSEGKWWTQNTYSDNIGAKPNQWKTTYERNSQGHCELSPRRAAHFRHFQVAKYPSTYELSEELHSSPRIQNAKNRKEYHKAKDWFNSIRKPEYINHHR